MESDPERLVTLKITYEEAVVLSGWFARLRSNPLHPIPDSLSVGEAEKIALGQLETVLEPVVDEVFNPDWLEFVERTRAQLVKRYEI
jgi:hypothetical protein